MASQLKALVMMLATVFILGLVACDGNNTETAAGAGTTTGETPAAAGDAVQATQDAVGDAAAAVGDATQNAADATQEAAGEAVDATQEAADNAAESAAATAENAAEGVQDAAADVVNQLNDARQAAVSSFDGLDLTAATEDDLQNIEVAVATAKEELANAYQNADDAAQAQWAELEQEFNQVETALQDNASDALQQVQALVERIQADIQQ